MLSILHFRGEFMRDWIQVTAENYTEGEPMFCEECGEEWDVATFNWSLDDAGLDCKRPASICCNNHLVMRV